MITPIMEKLNFPEEAIESLNECYEKMLATDGFLADLEKVKEEIFCGEGRGFTEGLAALAEKTGTDRYQSDMVVLLNCIPSLKYVYHSRGIDESIMWDSMDDLRCKLFECKAVKGVWGDFVAYWQAIFFRLICFKLGRLEYEAIPCPIESYKDILSKGDKVLTCHIPSAGPLHEDQVMDSLRRAYEFFPEYRKGDVLPILCHSWLLYPHYEKTVFAEGSNIYKFSRLFEVVSPKVDENYGDLWRVFNVEYSEGCLASLPEDTTLRKNMKKFLLDGNKMGDAYCVLLFDGEKILTKRS